MRQLKIRIKRLLDNNKITNVQEQEKLAYLVNTKRWNPYCIRHSSITNDSDYLPEYALKKVRWSMNSRQGTRYIKTRLGNELKEKILQYNGIICENISKNKISILNCPRCDLVNAIENKYCSKCSYPLKPEAYEEIKASENAKINSLEKKVEETNNRMLQIISLIQQIPSLKSIKPEVQVKKDIDITSL